MYDLRISKKAIRQLFNLDSAIRKRVFKSLERIRFRPESFIIKLVGYPDFKLRVGDYRAILSVDKAKKIITLLRVNHRKKVYKK
jgi:mRNA interferase RelE/StbE